MSWGRVTIFLMFIREITKTAKGKKYIQHQLSESIRTPMGPRHRLVLSMGRIDLPKEDWKALTTTNKNVPGKCSAEKFNKI